FRELTLFDPDGHPRVSSRLNEPRLTLTKTPPDSLTPLVEPITVDDDLLPTTVVTIRIAQAGTVAGYLVGELRLEELWRLVDHIKIGTQGFALIIDDKGRLLAHGNPDQKPAVARGEHLATHPLV